LILETPIDKPGDDRRNVQALWELVGLGTEQAPKAEVGFSMLRRAAGGARRKTAKVSAKVAAKSRSRAKSKRAPARRRVKIKRKRSQR
jgi:hypothetical protein